MNTSELNQLAVEAKTDETKLWEIKAHYMQLIEKLGLENWHKMNSETAFDDDCFRRITYAVKSYDIRKGDFDKRVRTLLYQSVKEHCGRRGNRRKQLLSMDRVIDTEERLIKELTYTGAIEDRVTNVEEQAIEEVTKSELLNKYADNEMDRQVMEIILNAHEALNQSEITRRLAAKTGRTFNSARGVVRNFCARKQGVLC